MPFIHTRLIEKEKWIINEGWSSQYIPYKGIEISNPKKISKSTIQQLVYFTDKDLHNGLINEIKNRDKNPTKINRSVKYEAITTEKALKIYDFDNIIDNICYYLSKAINEQKGKNYILGSRLKEFHAVNDLLKLNPNEDELQALVDLME
tara:strand:- start:543 stop:989 length:447 start_codon:yes stop_codon:yes gene_type:complete